MEMIEIKRLRNRYIILFILMLIGFSSYGQSVINLPPNTMSKIMVNWEDQFTIAFNQSNKKVKVLDITLSDHQGNFIKKIQKPTVLGENRYSFSAQGLGVAKVDGNYYYLSFTANKNQSYKILFGIRVSEKPLKASLKVEAGLLNCGGEAASEFKFTPKVRNGHPPYDMTWMIANDPKGVDLIAKPSHFHCATKEDLTHQIFRFSIAEPKYIIFYIHDACGKEYEQVNELQCGETSGNDFTLSFQKLTKKQINTK